MLLIPQISTARDHIIPTIWWQTVFRTFVIILAEENRRAPGKVKRQDNRVRRTPSQTEEWDHTGQQWWTNRWVSCTASTNLQLHVLQYRALDKHSSICTDFNCTCKGQFDVTSAFAFFLDLYPSILEKANVKCEYITSCHRTHSWILT